MSWWGFKRKDGKPKIQSYAGLAMSEQLAKDSSFGSGFILSAIDDAVVMVSKDGIIQLFNPAASSMTGWPAEEAIGLDYHSVISLTDEHAATYTPEKHPFAESLRTNSSVRDSKGILITRSSKHIPISLIVSPVIEDINKMTTGVVGVFRDITREKAEEAQRSDFISTASHEMRTPIAAIEGYLALTLNPKICKIDDNARKYLQKASDSTTHLGILFQDLLTSSKAEDGRLTSYPAAVEIGEALSQTVDGARFNAKQKGLDLHFILSSKEEITGSKVIRPLYYTFVDPSRIREVFQNLVDNAIKYTMSGEINVRLTGDDSVVQIQVEDTGPGIPPEDVPHLFQKFYRVDNSMTRTVGGTGLGLFICRRIIEASNGRIWVESRLGKGSTFFVNLPRLTAEQAMKMQQEKAELISPLDN